MAPEPRSSGIRWESVSAAVLLALYALLLCGVLTGFWPVQLDMTVYRWSASTRWPALWDVAQVWVLLGQRGFCLAIAATWLGLRAWRTRNPRGLVVLAMATLLVNITVGGVKTLVARLGPGQLGEQAGLPGAAEVFAWGGTIFPSGHTANAVVTWGVMALLAHRAQRAAAVAAVMVMTTVGLTTVYLGTHWLSDVVAGWLAGALVLLMLPGTVRILDALWIRLRQSRLAPARVTRRRDGTGIDHDCDEPAHRHDPQRGSQPMSPLHWCPPEPGPTRTPIEAQPRCARSCERHCWSGKLPANESGRCSSLTAAQSPAPPTYSRDDHGRIWFTYSGTAPPGQHADSPAGPSTSRSTARPVDRPGSPPS